jgi:hypothetical protein
MVTLFLINPKEKVDYKKDYTLTTNEQKSSIYT